jgi:hypothetical protein
MPEPSPRIGGRLAAALALTLALSGGVARAQAPPKVPDIENRSGLMMRFTNPVGKLPPDPYRDNFYATRYADRGAVKHLRINPKDQGLYGLGWKAADNESVYPFFYGSPGQSTVTASSKPWPRPLRVFQGMAEPYRPVGMYYSMGSYVPIYDIDPVVPGPGPYPYPFYFNWFKGG